MNAAAYIFSFLCSQDAARSFTVVDRLLPVCQRCTGLYLGMGITLVFLVISRPRREDLSARSIIYVNIACLLAMPIFGFHLLDPGPAWRLWSGLIYGSAIASLLLPAASIICMEGRKSDSQTSPSTTSFWIFFAFLNSIPLWLPVQSSWFYYVGVLLMLVGLFGVVFCVSAVIVVLAKRLMISTVSKGLSNEC